MTNGLSREVLSLLVAGLAGLSPLAKSSAVDALSRTLYEHNASIAADLKHSLLSVVLLLLEDKHARVYRAALKFTKVTVYVTSKEELPKYLPQIVKLFSNRHVAHSKMLVRKIVERLSRLLPFEQLQQVFPQNHIALLEYVQKMLQRRCRSRRSWSTRTMKRMRRRA